MKVNANLAQDVFKDAGESVIFLMLSLKREDKAKEREIIADMADRIEAIQRSMNIRVAPETVKLTFGFSNRAWNTSSQVRESQRNSKISRESTDRTIKRRRRLPISSCTFAQEKHQRLILSLTKSWDSCVLSWMLWMKHMASITAKVERSSTSSTVRRTL